MCHCVESVGILHPKSKVILVHDCFVRFHIHWLYHVSEDFLEIKRFFVVFFLLFCSLDFAFTFFLFSSSINYFFNFKFESNLILSIQYNLVESWRRRYLAYSCSSTFILPKNGYEGICSDIKRPIFFSSKFLKSIICTFVPLNLTSVFEIFFVGKSQIIKERSRLLIITYLICICDIETVKLRKVFYFSFDLIENMLVSSTFIRKINLQIYSSFYTEIVFELITNFEKVYVLRLSVLHIGCLGLLLLLHSCLV